MSRNQFKYTKQSEFVDLSRSGSIQCPSWAKYPYGLKGATGGLLGTNAIVCGGFEPTSDECHKITQKKTEFLTKMLSKRYNAASLVVKGIYLWVSGGNDGSTTLSSSEFIEIETTPGPNLPEALEGHAMIDITDDLTLLIGGASTKFVEFATSTSGTLTSTVYWENLGHCLDPSSIGDNICDDENNFKQCNYDGGDCCNGGEWNSFIYCTACRCLDSTRSCVFPNKLGDNICDDENNFAECDYDEGDCCGPNTGNRYSYCTDCRCLEYITYYASSSTVQWSTTKNGHLCVWEWAGDGYCDDKNNKKDCDYDGG